ncbi:MAG: DUF1641 domain-containing protein [Myxococcales bacterium]|nr:DUF1641 domain-containing protein [Myxococcales bacterium]
MLGTAPPDPVPPELAARLDRLEAGLDRVERALCALAALGPPAQQLATEGPRLAATAADVFDGIAADVPDFDARLRALLRFALRASRPETLDLLGGGLDLLERTPHAVAAAVDVFDAVLAVAAREGVDVNAFFGVAARFAVHLVRLGPAIDRLIDSGMLEARAIDTLGRVGRALSAQAEAPAESVGGLLAMLKVMRDPDVQRSLGFAVGLARRFGAAERTDLMTAR